MATSNSYNKINQNGNNNRIYIVSSEPEEMKVEDEIQWNRLLSSVFNFTNKRFNYYLISGTKLVDGELLKNLAFINWNMIIDFNCKSEQDGLYHYTHTLFENTRVIKNIIEASEVTPFPSLPWFFANGLENQNNLINYREWNRKYSDIFEVQLKNIAKDLLPKSGIFIIYGFDSQDLVDTIIKILDKVYDKHASIILIQSPEIEIKIPNNYEDICELITLTDEDFLNGIYSEFHQDFIENKEEYFIPRGETYTSIPLKDVNWIAEDLFILYKNFSEIEQPSSPTLYRKGHKITWNNIVQKHDCDRTITKNLLTKLKQDLTSKQVFRINLYHEPGAGGTTVSYRVAWELHDKYPICFLVHYSNDSTYRKICKIAELSNKSVLIIIDRELFSDTQVEDLYNKLKAESCSVVILQIIRKFDIAKRVENVSKSRQFLLFEELVSPEVKTFQTVYQADVPFRKIQIEHYVQSSEFKSAFLFGLAAYDDEYQGIDKYIKSRVNNLTKLQKDFLIYLSIAKYYGQNGLPIEVFKKHFGVKEINLKHLFHNDSIYVLDLIEENQGEISIIHFAIAKKIFEIILGTNWLQNLSIFGKNFISLCHIDLQTQSNKLISLLTKIFINRERTAVTNEKFSKFIEDIPSNEGKLSLLEYLSDQYPDNPHFLAHYGRALSLNHDYKKAAIKIKEAIQIQDEDHVLHHMYGMIFYNHIKFIEPTEEKIEELISLAQNAVESFEQSRLYMPDVEYSYTSEISLYLKLFEKINRATNQTAIEFIKNTKHEFLQKAFDKANTLLIELESVYGSDTPTNDFYDLQSKVSRLYGNYEETLQVFNNLLVTAPSGISKNLLRRNIVYTILERNKRKWDLNKKDLNRVIDLLTDNVNSEVKDTQSIKLWIRAIRESTKIHFSLDIIIEKLSYLKANTDSLDSVYYLYVYYAINLIEGAFGSLESMETNLNEISKRTRFRPDRRLPYEWYGKKKGIHRLVHRSKIWDQEEVVRHVNMERELEVVEGRISKILTPERGFISFNHLDIYFNPAKYKLEIGKDENKRVNFYLAFTYDGPIADSVKIVI